MDEADRPGHRAATDDDGKTLWFEVESQRCFLLPDELELPAGPLTIRSFLGGVRQVEEAAVAPYAVAREEIDARLRHKLEAAWSAAKAALQRAFAPAPATTGEAATSGAAAAGEGGKVIPLPLAREREEEPAADGPAGAEEPPGATDEVGMRRDLERLGVGLRDLFDGLGKAVVAGVEEGLREATAGSSAAAGRPGPAVDFAQLMRRAADTLEAAAARLDRRAAEAREAAAAAPPEGAPGEAAAAKEPAAEPAPPPPGKPAQ